MKLAQLPRRVVYHKVGYAPTVKFFPVCVFFQFRHRNTTIFAVKGYVVVYIITHKLTYDFALCEICVVSIRRQVRIDIDNIFAASPMPYDTEFFSAVTAIDLSMQRIFSVVLRAIDIHLKRRFKFRSCLSHLDRLFPACNKLAPFRLD